MHTLAQSPTAVKPMPKRTGRITLDRERGLVRRSILLTKSRALSFCRCQEGNPYVAWAEVKLSHSAKGDARYFVQWLPTNPERQDALYTQFAKDRQQRAIDQAAEFEFWPVDERPGWYWCIHDYGNGKPCGVYVVHPIQGCDTEGNGCPDRLFRGSKIGEQCKHFYALQNWLREASAAGTPAQPAPPVKLSAAERSRRIQEDFN